MKKKIRYSAKQLQDKMIDIIINRLEHQDYTRTCNLRRLYRQLSTGDGYEDLLQHFVPREAPDLFEQRKNFSFPITTCLTEGCVQPAQKIPKINPAVKQIAPKSDKQRDKAKMLLEKVDTFYGGQSLDEYLDDRFIELSTDIDPNAFVVVSFTKHPDDTTNDYEFFIKEISCENVIWFENPNNVLQLLVLRYGCFYESRILKDKDRNIWEPCRKDGNIYTGYSDNDAMTFTQVDETLHMDLKPGQSKTIEITVDGKRKEVLIYMVDEGRVFMIETFVHKAGTVPAERVGSIGDKMTQGRTCVNLWDPATPHLMRLIKTCSEMDLSMSLHAFPQKIVAQPRCLGPEGKGDCEGGRIMPGGKDICGMCHGSGLASVHKTTQDVIVIGIPKNKDDMLDLSKLVHYVVLPTDLLRLQSEFIDKNESKVYATVYNSDVLLRPVFAKTATESNNSYQSVYDTLRPVSKQYSFMWIRITTIFAGFLDVNDDVDIDHRFHRDLQFKSINDLLSDLKLANESNAPSFVKVEINKNMMEIIYQDQPEKMKQIRVKEFFDPFSGKSEADIASILSSDKVTAYSKVMFTEFKRIFVEAETRSLTGESPVSFYDLSPNKQKTLIDEVVQEFIDQLGEDNKDINFSDSINDAEKGADAITLISKLSLASQQLALSATRAKDDGDDELAAEYRIQMEEIKNKIGELVAGLEVV